MKMLVRVTVSVALFAAIFVFVPWSEVTAAFRRADLAIWTLALAGFLAGHMLGVGKWRLLVNASGARMGWRDATMCYAAGLFANLCLPSIVGGDVLRVALAGERTKRVQAAVWGSVIDRMNDLLATVMLVAVGLLVSQRALPGVWQRLALISAVILGLGVLALSLPVFLRVPLVRWPRVVRRHLGRTLVTLRRSARNPRAMALGLGASLMVQTLFTLLAAALGWSISIHIGLAAWFLAWPLAKIAGLLPISLGGLAVREAALASLLVPFGVAFADGVVASLLWQTVLIAGGLISGAAWRVLAWRSGTPASMHPSALRGATQDHG